MKDSKVRCRERVGLTWGSCAAVLHVGSDRQQQQRCCGQAGKVVRTESSVSMAGNVGKVGCTFSRPVEMSC